MDNDVHIYLRVPSPAANTIGSLLYLGHSQQVPDVQERCPAAPGLQRQTESGVRVNVLHPIFFSFALEPVAQLAASPRASVLSPQSSVLSSRSSFMLQTDFDTMIPL